MFAREEHQQALLDALCKPSGGMTPVEERLGVLRRYWSCFSDIHACQQPSHRSLFGLVETKGRNTPESVPTVDWVDGQESWSSTENPYQQGLWSELLPDELQADLTRLWSGIVNPRNFEQTLPAPFPHGLMAEAFGPALRFWHGCAVTAWFCSEGTSWFSMEGLAQYHQHSLTEMNKIGCPVNTGLFAELTKVEAGIPKDPKCGNANDLHASKLRIVAKSTKFKMQFKTPMATSSLQTLCYNAARMTCTLSGFIPHSGLTV